MTADPTPPTLSYEHRHTCGTVTVHRSADGVHVVAGPEPLRASKVAVRTIGWGLVAMLLCASATAYAHAVGWGTVLCLGGLAGVGFGLRWWRKPRRVARSLQLIASPAGLHWHASSGAQTWLPAADVGRVALHLSPPSVRRHSPVSVVLVLIDGRRLIVGHGTTAEAAMIADAVEEGLGMVEGPS